MKSGDTQYGAPFVQYTDTKANIVALSGISAGAVAYATDSKELGTYSGTTWAWGSGAWVTEILAGTINGSNKIFTTSAPYRTGAMVFINGLRQVKDVGYTESGASQITFSDAPSNVGFDDVLQITYLP